MEKDIIKIIEEYLSFKTMKDGEVVYVKGLNDEQKEFIKRMEDNKILLYHKHRRVGATTAIDAYIVAKAATAKKAMTFVILSPYVMLNKEHFDNIKMFVEQFPIFFDNSSPYEILSMKEIRFKNGCRILFTTNDMCEHLLCGVCVDYLFSDENECSDRILLSLRPDTKVVETESHEDYFRDYQSSDIFIKRKIKDFSFL